MISRRGLFSLPLALPFIAVGVKAATPELGPENHSEFWVADAKPRDDRLFQWDMYIELKKRGATRTEAIETVKAWCNAAEVTSKYGVATITFPVKFLKRWVESHYAEECEAVCRKQWRAHTVKYGVHIPSVSEREKTEARRREKMRALAMQMMEM